MYIHTSTYKYRNYSSNPVSNNISSILYKIKVCHIWACIPILAASLLPAGFYGLNAHRRKKFLSRAPSSYCCSCASSSSKRGCRRSPHKSHNCESEAHEIRAELQHTNRCHGLALLTTGIYVRTSLQVGLHVVYMQLMQSTCSYGVATVSRIDKITGLFCRI